MAVNLTKLSVNVNNIQGLSDRPNTIDGLTSAELKAKFDKAGSDIKEYLNGTLTVELQQLLNNINNSISELGTTIETQLEQQKDTLFPIGKIVAFYDNNDHSNYLGFSWMRILTGKMPIGIDTNDTDFNEIGKTDGEKLHTLTTNEMPNHSHRLSNNGNYATSTNGSTALALAFGPIASGGSTGPTASTGGGQPHNNMPPYEVVAFWKRVS